MQNGKCIPIKKKLIAYMSTWFPDFLFQGGNSQFYAFRRENPNGIYDHIIIQREYYEGTVSLVVTEAASCYNKSWRGIPWFTVGYDTNIGVIISGKKQHDTDIGWHVSPILQFLILLVCFSSKSETAILCILTAFTRCLLDF